MKKSDKVKIPKKDFVKEHKKLIAILRSPSHKDDIKEADEQESELSEVDKSATDVDSRSPSDKKLANKIYDHNKKKLHSFVKNMKKSLDFKDTLVSVDSTDQMLAEKTVSPVLVKYIKDNAMNDINKIPFPNGMLTLSKREAGLYNGFFQDQQGQIIEKFDSQTVEIVAKVLEVKSLVPTPVEPPPPVTAVDPINVIHDRIDQLEQNIKSSDVKGIKIKYGDFELEIKKSVRDFVNDFKSNQPIEKDVVRKAIGSWRKKQSEYMQLGNDQSAARELLSNWDQHQNSFCQFVDALTRMSKKNG